MTVHLRLVVAVLAVGLAACGQQSPVLVGDQPGAGPVLDEAPDPTVSIAIEETPDTIEEPAAGIESADPPADEAVELRVSDETGRLLTATSVLVEGDHSLRVDDGATIVLPWEGEPVGVWVRPDGFEAQFLLISSPGALTVAFDPVVLSGTVVDEEGRPVQGAAVSLQDELVRTDHTGRFEFTGLTAGEVRVRRPLFSPVTVQWGGGSSDITVRLERMMVKAVHVTGPAVASDVKWGRLLELAGSTELNAMMVDIKDESGRVFYSSEVEAARRVGAVDPMYEPAELRSQIGGLYLIGRIVTFQDPIAARAEPEWAVWDAATDAPYRQDAQYFLDPTDPAAQDYALDLAEEACARGFDEIQFDYVRYPDRVSGSQRYDGGSSSEVRRVFIRDFLMAARERLHLLGCAVAADIFGFITSTLDDGGIGQHLETLAPAVDVLSPMLYPSHYSEGWFGFTVPNDHPGPVVAAALDDALARIGDSVVIRPWLQDFYYNAAQVRAEIDASEERGLGWMLWNASSNVTEGALLPDG